MASTTWDRAAAPPAVVGQAAPSAREMYDAARAFRRELVNQQERIQDQRERVRGQQLACRCRIPLGEITAGLKEILGSKRSCCRNCGGVGRG